MWSVHYGTSLWHLYKRGNATAVNKALPVLVKWVGCEQCDIKNKQPRWKTTQNMSLRKPRYIRSFQQRQKSHMKKHPHTRLCHTPTLKRTHKCSHSSCTRTRSRSLLLHTHTHSFISLAPTFPTHSHISYFNICTWISCACGCPDWGCALRWRQWRHRRQGSKWFSNKINSFPRDGNLLFI